MTRRLICWPRAIALCACLAPWLTLFVIPRCCGV